MSRLSTHRLASLVLAAAFALGLVGHAAGGSEREKSVELEDVSDAEKVKWARATKVDIAQAIRAATARTPGQVIEAALHSISGRLLYEIEVVTKEGTVVEVFVDPQSGRVIEGSHR